VDTELQQFGSSVQGGVPLAAWVQAVGVNELQSSLFMQESFHEHRGLASVGFVMKASSSGVR
jgi:hypothetical protein